MTKLKISDDLSLPLDAVTQTFGFFGRKGSGKTYAAGKLVEVFLDAGVPVVVLDPVGNWFGVRLDQSGKHPSRFTLPIIGGEHGDVPLTPQGGSIVADFVVNSGASAIVDVSRFRKGERKEFVTAFAEQLFHRKKSHRTPMHFVIEEAQVFAPQRAFKGEERMLGALEDIVRLGRNYGIGASMISQRPQSVNTELRNQCEPLVVFQLVAKHERDAIGDWMEHMGVDSDLEALARLQTGECFFWSPAWLNKFVKTKFLPKETFDASATPKMGARGFEPKKLGPVDLDALQAAMKDTIERAKAEDPRELHKQIADLKRQLKAKQAPAAATVPKAERVEVPVLKDGQLGRAEKIAERMESQGQKLLAESQELRRTVAAVGAKPVSAARPVPPRVHDPTLRTPSGNPMTNRQRDRQRVESNGDVKLGKCHRAILQVLSQYPMEGCAADKLTILAGYRYSGSFQNALGDLRREGYMVGENKGVMQITETGLNQGPFEELPVGQELQQYWIRHPSLGKCARLVLGELIAAYPDGRTAEQICQATGYEYSGSFQNALGDLRTAGVLVGRNTGEMTAAEAMFE